MGVSRWKVHLADTPKHPHVVKMIMTPRKENHNNNTKKGMPVHQLLAKRMPVASNPAEFVAMRDYSENSAMQNFAAFLLSKMIEKNAEGLFSTDSTQCPSKVVKVVDYGCATGSSSLDPLRAIQAAAGSNRRVLAVMNDLPLNDWATLKQTLKENVPDVDVQIASQSMYKDVVAEKGSVHIGFSCFAQHWLSRGVPCPLPIETGALWGNQLAGLPKHKTIYEQWSKESRKDWERFLELRAEELQGGGVLVLLIQSALLDGTMSDGLAYGCQVAKKQCLEEGIFTVKEALAMCMPEYSKNIIEILEPLQSEDNGLSSKWKVLECQELPSYALVDHQIDPTTAHQSSRERAEITVNLAKSFMNSSLERAFKKEDREEKLGRFWKKVFEFGEANSSDIDTNIGGTLLALERRNCQDCPARSGPGL